MILNSSPPPFNHAVKTTKQSPMPTVCLISLLVLNSTVGMKEKISPGAKSFSSNTPNQQITIVIK
jgi:hypothetical protein